jgi:hypothetical protein
MYPVIVPVARLDTPTAPIVIEKPVGPALPAALVAVTLIVLVPAVVGVPESSPPLVNVNPPGTASYVQVIGVSPIAWNCAE